MKRPRIRFERQDVDRESIVYGKESIVRRDVASHSFL